MAFQFSCPQGHWLQGDESQAGQTCQCPVCGQPFIIPAPVAPAAVAWHPGMPNPDPQPSSPQTSSPGPQQPAATPQPQPQPQKPAVEQPPPLLHIPCPNGHELEVPREMLDEDVMCPHCKAEFHLRERDSIEYKRKRQMQEEQRLARMNKLWFNGAIAIAVLIVLFLLALILLR